VNKTEIFELICKALLIYTANDPNSTEEIKNQAMDNFLNFLDDNLKPKSRTHLRTAFANVVKEAKQYIEEEKDGEHKHGSGGRKSGKGRGDETRRVKIYGPGDLHDRKQ
jgi:hypothetical protein